jgi:hypothetical protein
MHAQLLVAAHHLREALQLGDGGAVALALGNELEHLLLARINPAAMTQKPLPVGRYFACSRRF